MNSRKLSRSLFVLLFGMVLGMLSFSIASAQTGTASLSGTVKDPEDRAIAGASITLKNQEKNFSRTQVTDSNGSYRFAVVPPDTYSVDVEATGFKKTVTTNVKVSVDNPAKLDVQLEVGQVQE